MATGHLEGTKNDHLVVTEPGRHTDGVWVSLKDKLTHSGYTENIQMCPVLIRTGSAHGHVTHAGAADFNVKRRQ